MKHNDFECRQCGAHFNSRAEMQRHNKDQHSQHGRSASGSSSSTDSYGEGDTRSGSSSYERSSARDRDSMRYH